MKIAIPGQEQKISPWLDSTHQLWIVDIQDGKQTNRKHYWLEEPSPVGRVKKLQELGVNVLICGAISRNSLIMLQKTTIQVIPWISGDIHEVLRAFCEGEMSRLGFNLPDYPVQQPRRS